jgi:cytochrome c oxidase assembly factor CtaG
MQTSIGTGEAIAFFLIVGLVVAYVVGWRRLHRAMPMLARRLRLVAFCCAALALTLGLVWPFPSLGNELLAMRSLQNVSIAFVAVPLLWLSVPVQTIVWGLRGRPRRGLVNLYRVPWLRSSMQHLSQPLVTWFIYLSAFLFWHDASFAGNLLGPHIAHTLAPWVLLMAALLFWWPIVDTGPRFNRAFPLWLLIVYVLSVEIANMVAGITIAFSIAPLYPYYPAVRAHLSADTLPWSQVTDQIAGGAIIWVGGSIVYFSTIVFILLRLFRSEGSSVPQPMPNWDDDAKFIAPGLEHRVAQNYLRKADLSHH